MSRLRVLALLAAVVACDPVRTATPVATATPDPVVAPVAPPSPASPPTPVDPPAPVPSLPPFVTQLDPALGPRLDAVIDKLLARDGVGLVVLVARDGKIIYERAAGFADREAKLVMRTDTQFRIASMTKPIVSATALALVEQGKLSLDDPVTRWLPDFRPKLADGREPVITVRHLITHTAGLGYGFLEKLDGPLHRAGVSDGLAEPELSLDENLKRLASVPLLYEPGKRFRYSLAIDVLGAVITKAGGATLPELVDRLVTRRLGMTSTMFTVTDRARLAWPYNEGKGRAAVRMTEPYDRPLSGGKNVRYSPGRIFDPTSYPSGGSGLASSARDYLRFLEELRTGGTTILRAETIRAMTQNQIGNLQADSGEGFGFGAAVITDPVAAKSPRGSGSFTWAGIYGTKFWVDPQARLTVVILTNVVSQVPVKAIEKVLYAR